jgi:hypothetical protein
MLLVVVFTWHFVCVRQSLQGPCKWSEGTSQWIKCQTAHRHWWMIRFQVQHHHSIQIMLSQERRIRRYWSSVSIQKYFYPTSGLLETAAVPEVAAVVKHNWWNGGSGNLGYKQIRGWAWAWAWGDSMCILEWPSKILLTFPTLIEHVTFIILPLAIYTKQPITGLLVGLCVVLLERMIKMGRYYPQRRSNESARVL